MWFIEDLSSGNKITIEKSEFSVGRKGTDIVLSNDDSISRVHANFILDKNGLSIQDKSKYGTRLKSINGQNEKLDDKPKALQEGDHICFGILQNVWVVHKEKSQEVASLSEISTSLSNINNTASSSNNQRVQQRKRKVSEDVVEISPPIRNLRARKEDPKPVAEPKKPEKQRKAPQLSQDIEILSLGPTQNESVVSELTSQGISSARNNSSGLFNFSNKSLSSSIDSSRIQKKRKNADEDEPIVESSHNLRGKKPASKPVKEPATKRNKIHRIIDEDSDENEVPSRQTRERTAKTAMGNDKGLFAFSTKTLQKPRQTSSEAVAAQRTASGIIPLATRQLPAKELTQDKDVDEDSCDSGVWLSKKVTSVKLSDSVDGIKKEKPEPESSFVKTEDINPEHYQTLFNVHETTSFNSITSVVSKRKQFVKKKNYKAQSTVAALKSVPVEDTYQNLDDF